MSSSQRWPWPASQHQESARSQGPLLTISVDHSRQAQSTPETTSCSSCIRFSWKGKNCWSSPTLRGEIRHGRGLSLRRRAQRFTEFRSLSSHKEGGNPILLGTCGLCLAFLAPIHPSVCDLLLTVHPHPRPTPAPGGRDRVPSAQCRPGRAVGAPAKCAEWPSAVPTAAEKPALRRRTRGRDREPRSHGFQRHQSGPVPGQHCPI